MDLPDFPEAMRFHQFKVADVMFECPERYSLIRPIGKGAYGVVCSADDLATGECVAIKRIGNAFDSALDARRTLREIRLLRRLRHENVVGLRSVFPPPMPGDAFQDVYLVYDLLDTDLHQLIRSPQPLPREHVQFIAYQLLRALKYLHSAGVVHRDLKPSNLLLNANCDLKLADFGLARTGVDDAVMPEYVVTRWYRAPELLLSCTGYGAPIDVWSAGCILAELLGRKPLFPGRDFVHTLNLVCRVVGSPGAADVAGAPERARAYLAAMPREERAQLGAYFPGADPLAVDLLDKLLVFSPERRLTAAQALSHPYFAGLHDPGDEPAAPHPLPSDPELDTMPVAEVRAAIFQEMLAYEPRLARMQ